MRWIKRVNPLILIFVFVAAFIGLAVTATVYCSDPKPPPPCQDVLEHINGRLESAKCEPRQTMSYVQDVSGERYVICRCPNHKNASQYDAPFIFDESFFDKNYVTDPQIKTQSDGYEL